MRITNFRKTENSEKMLVRRVEYRIVPFLDVTWHYVECDVISQVLLALFEDVCDTATVHIRSEFRVEYL